MKSRSVCFALAILLTTVTSARAQTPEIPDIPFEKFELDNGLTLIVHEDHKAPIVAVNVWYHVGSKNEPPGRSGFAHLFEHLMFNGSENFDDDYFQVLERIGATELNGTTNGTVRITFRTSRSVRSTWHSGWNQIGWATCSGP